MKSVLVTFSLFLLATLISAGVRPNAPQVVNDGIDAYKLVNTLYGKGRNAIDSKNTKGIQSCGKTGAPDGGQCFLFTLNPTDNDNGKDDGKARIEAGFGAGVITKGSTWQYNWSFYMFPENEILKDFFNVHQIIGSNGPMASFEARNGQFLVRYKDKKWLSFAKPVENFKAKWINVEETIHYDNPGTYQARLTDAATKEVLIDVPKFSLNIWAERTRTEFGIYRRLGFKKPTRVAYSRWNAKKI